MNGLGGSDPVSTQHSSDGGRELHFGILCVGHGAGHFSRLPFHGGQAFCASQACWKCP